MSKKFLKKQFGVVEDEGCIFYFDSIEEVFENYENQPYIHVGEYELKSVDTYDRKFVKRGKSSEKAKK